MKRIIRMALAEYVAMKCGLAHTEKELAFIVKQGLSSGGALKRHCGSTASRLRVEAAIDELRKHKKEN